MANILKLLKQKSTWAGIVSIATGLGLALSPELKEAIISAGMAIVGLIGVIHDEDK